jgi:hypothetical protein
VTTGLSIADEFVQLTSREKPLISEIIKEEGIYNKIVKAVERRETTKLPNLEKAEKEYGSHNIH